ncbi:hypothetical protein ACGABU_002516 [Morganella morganii]|uniref:hypothetical protein n=1 Tax=Morganella morganii TaxID=582 RepID=UPI0018B0DC34|nr:hypothetical protein [Morganella morganii]QPJ67307.1 hypothetical protein IR188_11520 [Morganella morganii]HEO9697889.1 hypothetical protein [Morganella morganii subsp. morganii]
MKIKKVSFVWKNIDKSEQYLIDMVTCKIETDDGAMYEGSVTQPIFRQYVMLPPTQPKVLTPHEIGEVAAYNHTMNLIRQVVSDQM